MLTGISNYRRGTTRLRHASGAQPLLLVVSRASFRESCHALIYSSILPNILLKVISASQPDIWRARAIGEQMKKFREILGERLMLSEKASGPCGNSDWRGLRI